MITKVKSTASTSFAIQSILNLEESPTKVEIKACKETSRPPIINSACVPPFNEADLYTNTMSQIYPFPPFPAARQFNTYFMYPEFGHELFDYNKAFSNLYSPEKCYPLNVHLPNESNFFQEHAYPQNRKSNGMCVIS